MHGTDKLRAELDERGLKPLDLARKLGMKYRTVRDVLRGHPDVRLRDVAIIAGALGFNTGVVLEERTVLDELIEPKEVRRPRRPQVKWK